MTKRTRGVVTMRSSASPLLLILAAADRIRDAARVARSAERYVLEIETPNIREPFSIANRRQDLRELVLCVIGRRSQTRPGGGFARRAA